MADRELFDQLRRTRELREQMEAYVYERFTRFLLETFVRKP